MCVFITCVYIYIYKYTRTLSVSVSLSLSLSLLLSPPSLRLPMYLYICICRHAYIDIYVYIYVFVHRHLKQKYIYTYIYTYIQTYRHTCIIPSDAISCGTDVSYTAVSPALVLKYVLGGSVVDIWAIKGVYSKLQRSPAGHYILESISLPSFWGRLRDQGRRTPCV